MFYYIENRNIDPYYNLALEQTLMEFALTEQAGEHSYFMLWQNENAVIVGRHQNTAEEINAAFVKEHNIRVVRRLSGGGAVYHDLGNLNYTFIVPASQFPDKDFSYFCKPVCEALLSLGIPAEVSGRNDMAVNGKKFSGSARYVKDNKILHHGTILYDTDLDMLSGALVPKDKIESRGIKSKQSPVANIRPHMKHDTDIDGFWIALQKYMTAAFDMRETAVSREIHEAALELKEKRYSQWSWNYGSSPPHTLRKTGRIEGCGMVDVFLDIGRGGLIKSAAFCGDFFSGRDPAELGNILAGHYFEYNELNALLRDVDISLYFNALDKKAFFALVFDL